MMPWLIAILSTAVCLFLWLRDARRIMRSKESTLLSAARQVITCRKKAEEAPYDPETARVLERSESIYQQGLDLYHQTLNSAFYRIPAKLLGYRAIEKEEYLLDLEDPLRSKSSESRWSKLKRSAAGYFGSVRFFKNLILLTVIVLIAVPTFFVFRLCSGLNETKQTLEETLQETQIITTGLGVEIETLTLKNEELRTQRDEQKEKYLKEIAGLELELEAVVEEQERQKQEAIQAEPPYAGLYPDFYAPQELSADTRETGVIYLTFDDGPSARTLEVLDILKEKGVKATFFVVGSTDRGGEEILRRIVAEGHTLGMHTFSHVYSEIYASVEAYLADMYLIFNQIKDATGTAPTLFRFPGGSINGYNSAIYQDLVAEMMRRGFVPFDWNISSADASERPVAVDVLVSNVIQGAQNVERGVVLMHDSTPRMTTVEALGTIIDELRAMGFELKELTPDVMPLLYAYRN